MERGVKACDRGQVRQHRADCLEGVQGGSLMQGGEISELPEGPPHLAIDANRAGVGGAAVNDPEAEDLCISKRP